MTINKNRIVYHGTQEKPGTPSKNIRQPSLRNPFFIGTTPEIALSYVNDEGSIFILYLNDDPNKIGLDLSKINNVERLSSKLPKTAKALKYWIEQGGYNTDGSKATFWHYIQFLINYTSFIAKNGHMPSVKDEDFSLYEEELFDL